MRSLLVVVFVLATNWLLAQTTVTGQVIDSITRQPLPFVSIGCKGEPNGTMTNEEGRFVLKLGQGCDMEFHLLGYATKRLSNLKIATGITVVLAPSAQTLKEVVVGSNDEAMYKALLNVRQYFMNTASSTARCYFLLNTRVDQRPVELMEMYYNATWQAGCVDQLRFKNGRAAMSPSNDRYFMSKNHSALFKASSMITAHQEMPVHPLQCGARELRKQFSLSLELITSGEEVYRVIHFKPRKNNHAYCEGTIWLKQLSDVPIKYQFKAEATPRHPFKPWVPGEAEIEQVTIQQEWQFTSRGTVCVPLRAQIAYHYNYRWLKLMAGKATNLPIQTTINAFFYNHNDAFIEPLVNYDERIYDYRKIAGLTWNDQFWLDQHSMVTTRSTQALVREMLKEGLAINYGGAKVTYVMDNRPLIKDLHVLWDKTKRLNVLQVKGDEVRSTKERFHLNAQVYLDLNIVNGQLQWKSATIFDLYHSWCYLENTPDTKCFMNMYFDLFECARLELESKLTPATSPEEAKRLYKAIMEETNQLAERYLNEVRMGLNTDALKAWNEIIKKQLDIDNVQLFEIDK